MRRRQRRRLLWLTGLGLVAVAVVLIVTVVDGDDPPTEADDNTTENTEPKELAHVDSGGRPNGRDDGGTTEPAPTPSPTVPPADPPLDAAKARRSFEQGLALVEREQLVAARTLLSAAVFSEHLSDDQADEARRVLWRLAQQTIFSPRAYRDDPYTLMHRFERGDRLADKRVNGKTVPGIVNGQDLRVPSTAILMANGVSAKELQAGKSYKLIRGPFHVTVHKDAFVMDVFLQRAGEDWPRTFIRRLPVGLGKNGSTPVGSWLVDDKSRRATWYPPPETKLPSPIRYGHPEYAFGRKGLWIGMKGIDANTRTHDGYGIHSTNDPESIGTESSLGCIRLADGGIEFVYNVLYEGHSTVYIRP
ncbi:MAG: L,D-transpeptidase [Phycisphaerae bacterium]|nr:L,D-transpeptidase [Phycisphaerae bacterium]